MQVFALLGAESFCLLNAIFVFHLLHDAIAGGIQMTQEQLFPSFLVFFSHGRGALAENDLVHHACMGGNNSDCSHCSKSNHAWQSGHWYQRAIGFMARLARRRVNVPSERYSSSSHLQLSSYRSVSRFYSFISLRHKVAATTRQLAKTGSSIRMSRRQSYLLSLSHHSPVSVDILPNWKAK